MNSRDSRHANTKIMFSFDVSRKEWKHFNAKLNIYLLSECITGKQ